MTDDINVTPIVPANITGDDIGSAVAFARIQAANPKESVRQNTSISSVSPTRLRIAHQPITVKSPVKRSLTALDQSLARLDAQSNVISIDSFSVKLQSENGATVTEAEYLAAWNKLIGYAVAGDNAGLKAMYRGEV